ncbi:HNH endonuclease [Halarcobacter sp.]|uniref:HNH endonuclease n=1 Tax=Halarcobacter sp. TaxID=2321133 RepID=UPI003A939439
MTFEELFIHIISKGKKDNTYKFALAKFLLDYSLNLRDIEDTKIYYREISEAFLKYYWFQECKYKIKQDFKQSSQPIVITIIQNFCGTEYIPDSYDKYFKKNKFKEDLTKLIEKKCLNDVIPRFQPWEHNNFYFHNHEKSNKKYKVPSDDDKFILLQAEAISFLKKNYELLHKALILEWAKFLEKTNFTPKLISKIENLGETKRNSLTRFKKILLEIDNKKCFYCNCDLDNDDIHVDHFIPWSYVFDDELWNLVLSCSKCNLKKSDYLASENSLVKIQTRNEKLNLVQINKDITEYYHSCKKAGFLMGAF